MEFKNQHLTRQMDIIPMNILSTPINIIGAGAVGGWVTLSLAKMGFTNLTVFDYDKVDVENMAYQFFRYTDIGYSKVHCLADLVQGFTNVKINVVEDKYTSKPLEGIVISAVDNMTTRKEIFEAQKVSLKCKFIIDPRMGGEYAVLYVHKNHDRKSAESYEITLHTDKEAEHERCTAKGTMYTVNLLAGLTCKAVKDVLTTDKYLSLVQYDIGANDIEMYTEGV